VPEENPDTDNPPVSADLSLPEATLLAALRAGSEPCSEESLVEETGLHEEAVRGSLQRLRSKHLAIVLEENLARVRLTPRGEATVNDGLPERRLLDALRAGASDAPDLTPTERSAAIGILRRRGFLAPGAPFRLSSEGPALAQGPIPEETALQALARGEEPPDPTLLPALERRGLARTEHITRRRWLASEEGRAFPLDARTAEKVGALTREWLASGNWRDAAFRPYDVRADVPYVGGARPHPYAAWLEEFSEVLVGLGFEEAEGPLVETEFWNGDALFMPQDHPARSIHDVLHVEGVRGRAPASELLGRVAAAHEGRPIPPAKEPLSVGWTAHYDRALAGQPVLRSQTTAVSARYLARGPKPPFRMFSIGRNFRFEALDARHHIEFGQCEGVIGQEGVSLRHLIGIFTELSEAIGIRELKFRPSYFPFTEPSVEGYVRHPRHGWMEVFPGGLLRPEVLRPLGIDVPVAAWGIGITRLAMTALGINDIRDLFNDDLGMLRGGSD
jgi:phenylalanyl-tRNA synthetase alpha chain